jgi:hypothetical protein
MGQYRLFALGDEGLCPVRGAMNQVVGEVAHGFTVPIVRRRTVILCKLPVPKTHSSR